MSESARIHHAGNYQAVPKGNHNQASRNKRETKPLAEPSELIAQVRQAQRGSATAMVKLIEAIQEWSKIIAYGVLGDAHLSEDAAQEVCLRVLKHLRRLEAPESFRPWVYRMTRNIALSMLRQREHYRQSSLQKHKLQAERRAGAVLEDDEGLTLLFKSIARLPAVYREVLVLKYIQNLSYAKMSETLRVSIKSLEIRLVRARKMLQERLGRRFERGRKHDPKSPNLT